MQKPKPATNSTNINPEDLKELLKNGTVNMDEILKGMNGTFKNVANITTETENGEVKKNETVSEENKEEKKEENNNEEKKEEKPEL